MRFRFRLWGRRKIAVSTGDLILRRALTYLSSFFEKLQLFLSIENDHCPRLFLTLPQTQKNQPFRFWRKP